jgi:starch synthase
MTASVMVVHNLAHQGIFPLELARKLEISDLFLDVDGVEALGAMNFLKGGILSASMVITVSPTYAREIVWPDYGEGLEQALLARGDDLVGILNGLDVADWDPARDPRLAAPFDAGDLAGKASCKAALQRELGLREGPEFPLFGVVSRLDPQKGIDLVEMVAPRLVEQHAQLVVLGVGQHRLIEPLIGLAGLWRQSVAVVERFDEALAHRIYAAADFFLMPSRFEPCGLGQMVALRYGAAPVVRRTGGLADTVRDLDAHPHTGNGFVFEHADAGGLHWACERALRLFREDPDRLDALRRAGMAEDFSWDRSARTYDKVLERAVLRERRRVML